MVKFWCCYVDGTGSFIKKHLTREDAKKEAARLAGKEQKKVYILEVVEYCQVENPPVVFHTV